MAPAGVKAPEASRACEFECAAGFHIRRDKILAGQGKSPATVHLERRSVAIHDTIEKVHCELINLFISGRSAIALDA
jgi:hypothetical protein